MLILDWNLTKEQQKTRHRNIHTQAHTHAYIRAHAQSAIYECYLMMPFLAYLIISTHWHTRIRLNSCRSLSFRRRIFAYQQVDIDMIFKCIKRLI